jgi:hypothetical protein
MEENALPPDISYSDLVVIVSSLLQKTKYLELEIQSLKESKKRKRKKVSEPEKPRFQEVSFTVWIKECVLPSIKDYLIVVFENDIIYGISRLLEDCIKKMGIDKSPIRIFEPTHRHVFYIYDDDLWKKVSPKELESHTWEIYQQFSKDFYNHWCIPNQTRIEDKDDQYSQYYIEYFKAILGNANLSHEKRNQKICCELYKSLL